MPWPTCQSTARIVSTYYLCFLPLFFSSSAEVQTTLCICTYPEWPAGVPGQASRLCRHQSASPRACARSQCRVWLCEIAVIGVLTPHGFLSAAAPGSIPGSCSRMLISNNHSMKNGSSTHTYTRRAGNTGKFHDVMAVTVRGYYRLTVPGSAACVALYLKTAHKTAKTLQLCGTAAAGGLPRLLRLSR